MHAENKTYCVVYSGMLDARIYQFTNSAKVAKSIINRQRKAETLLAVYGHCSTFKTGWNDILAPTENYVLLNHDLTVKEG